MAFSSNATNSWVIFIKKVAASICCLAFFLWSNSSCWSPLHVVILYMQWLLQAGCKFLIFAHHLPMIDAIHEFLLVRPLKFYAFHQVIINTNENCSKFPEKKGCLHPDWWRYTIWIKATIGYRVSGKRYYQGSSGMTISFMISCNYRSVWSVEILTSLDYNSSVKCGSI